MKRTTKQPLTYDEYSTSPPPFRCTSCSP